MKILITNDDGVYAPGLSALVRALSELGDVLVVAPDRNRSAASNSLTLDRPLEIFQHENGFYSINGTPTDCVHIGGSGVLGMEPDIVVSGINAGPNLGDDVIYSGTVAAAMEGRHFRYPAIAISSGSFHPNSYEGAAQVARDIVANIQQLNVAPRTILNVNVPDCLVEEFSGIHVTRLGHRLCADKPIATHDPRGKVRYWVAGAGLAADREPGTDFYALDERCVSITPLHVDMTEYAGMDNVGDWLERSF
ncbi:5'/3'-nucleotidase SurE [Neptuniibacter pectenicola]|jgi:5'-nucleotidase|uniref:5'-nucleotidase SurE n=1 Tax=Neptuniibacter pectenicola TaxID=1806669 RepID=A0ABU9TQA8_9GAMM|nr:5'/3'-nucleotidase SurE [Neptuniibacter pectenicola]KXJ55010.1 MAG: 5'/3'-nucleotidase SurE [Neptuniibacter sp. Phe_28]|tara:strand:- start:2206 stop:2955 length:750 start_codon:yes stop_codon:yes gene_type:complete|eukprot:gnl/Carplike_NY0171/19306_a30571_84.p1 GENE.gnl/Carplike_NY0171/19306_a30571_84~~gnl/Carplike_NY0171/19306_a30571_84.p1  ORF type:complete len:250 (-),score=5.09 gnl/Carplike_NY0171/19306_a30571_84:269-1018(-)